MRYRPTHLRISGVHFSDLYNHLFDDDGKEAVAFAVCGRHRASDYDVLLVQDVLKIPYEDCPIREVDRVVWRTDAIENLLLQASLATPKLGVVKFHSHPTGHENFSNIDDDSDRDLFLSIFGWVDDDGPHASVVLLPNGKIFGRVVDENGDFTPIERILVADHNISLCATSVSASVPKHSERHAQFFGDHTANVLRDLVVGVVGCSGTGSFVIEMLARLGVRQLVLVDPDYVEGRNLNRIIGTTGADVGRLKVEVLREHVANMGLNVQVLPVASEVASVQAVRSLAGCDIVFGCIDNDYGRQTLNSLACFYLLPYFDCGVSLTADGRGGIEEVSAACHYIQPGRSTLLGRDPFRQERAFSQAVASMSTERHSSLRREKYIERVEVGSPAVISINAVAASMAINEFLARLHPFRFGKNEQYGSVRFNLADMHVDTEPETSEQPLGRALGRGDVDPLLEMPDLSLLD